MSADAGDEVAVPRSWIRRHRVGVIVWAIVLVVLVAGVIGLVRVSDEVKRGSAIEYVEAVASDTKVPDPTVYARGARCCGFDDR